MLGKAAANALSRIYGKKNARTGFLYVSRRVTKMLEPPLLDLHAAEMTAPHRYEIRPDARRFEVHADGEKAFLMYRRDGDRLGWTRLDGGRTLLGQLAASVVHEINNPMTAVATYADALQQRYLLNPAADPADRDKLKKIIDNSNRILRFTLNAAIKDPRSRISADRGHHQKVTRTSMFREGRGVQPRL